MFNFINKKFAKVKASRKLRKLIKVFRKYFGEKDPGNINFHFDSKPSRMQIVQEIINIKKFDSYLEIGTFNDELFSFIKCKKKIGIDPFSGGTHRMTSDEYFKKFKDKFDLIFIDGLHHYNQVEKDIYNSLKILNDNGILLMHDCLPQSLSAQAIPRTETVWNGDVWKVFVKMRTDPNLDCYTCCADHGIGVIFKRNNKNLLNVKINNFKKLKFIDFYNNHKKLMNIIDFDNLLKII